MSRFRPIFLIAALLLACRCAFAETGSDQLIELSKRPEPRAYEFAKSIAEITPTRDGRSFTVWWQPKNFNHEEDTVLVSLHGHAGWATRDFQVWYPRLKTRKYAFMAVQWWYGSGDKTSDYATPHDIYPWIRQELEKRGIPVKHVIFEGFSRGSANCYAVTYLDCLHDKPYFAVTIANAGPMEADYPPNHLFLRNPKEPQPFMDTHWILYCGENDREREGICEKMEWTKNQLEELGGTVDKFIRDPNGSHGGFMKPEIQDEALSIADRIIAEDH